MRVFLKICAALLIAANAVSAATETPAKDFIERGASFYARGDYASAKELFKQVKLDGSQESGVAAFFLGSIYANEGSTDAFKLLEYAVKYAPKGMDATAAVQCARFALLNGKPEIAESTLSKFATPDASADTIWYYSSALWAVGKKDSAKNLFLESLKKNFASISAVGVDVFIDARLSKNDFAEAMDISGLEASNGVSLGRLQILKGEKITPPQAELSLLGQIEKIDQLRASGDENFDVQALEKSLSEYSQAPFSWRAALILSEYYTAKKDYEKGLAFAKTAQFLAPPEMAYQGRLLIAEADALRFLKKYADADAVYLKVVMNKAARGELAAEATYKTGLNWFEQGEWGKAHAYFERVFVLYFKYEYWGARAYYYAAQSLYSLGLRREANATLSEYFRRAKDRSSPIFKSAMEYYRSI